MGLFAAIPAGIFFNRYADRVGRIEVRYDTFMEELSAIFQRNAARREFAPRDGAAGERVAMGAES
jgi:biopolymer transport protein TolQ